MHSSTPTTRHLFGITEWQKKKTLGNPQLSLAEAQQREEVVVITNFGLNFKALQTTEIRLFSGAAHVC
ncbi:unnamed protein product [Lactuca virosa]|uniref:Uncharacterized protein n=1 Tax=Lactuca virosa TaxID=75947 RepID=A0AAU9NHY5_9ASTR|nr:unnamed protein product [Lactuca virosa]